MVCSNHVKNIIYRNSSATDNVERARLRSEDSNVHLSFEVIVIMSLSFDLIC